MYIFIGKFALRGERKHSLCAFFLCNDMCEEDTGKNIVSVTRVFMTLTFKVFRTKFQVLNCLGWKFAKWNHFSSFSTWNIKFHKFVSLLNYKVFLIGFHCDISSLSWLVVSFTDHIIVGLIYEIPINLLTLFC